MFTNLIESASHVREFKRRSSFFLITVATYAFILFAAGIASVYAYDAQLESQSNSLEILSWVPPVTPVPHDVRPAAPRPRANNTNQSATVPTRPILYESPSNPRTPPTGVSSAPNLVPPAPPNATVGPRISDPGPGGPPMTGCKPDPVQPARMRTGCRPAMWFSRRVLRAAAARCRRAQLRSGGIHDP